jgi:hypothetical protein
MSIELTNRVIDKRYRLKRTAKQTCSNCRNMSRILYNYENLPHSLCELCNTVFRYSARTMCTGIICQTEKSQVEIIRQTYDFLKTNKRVPKISEIDPSAKIANYPFPDLLKGMKSSTKKQRLKFDKLKLYFTDMIDYNTFPFASMFWRPSKYLEYQFFEVVAAESGRVDLSSVQKGIIELYINDPSLDSDNSKSNSKSSNTKKFKPATKTARKSKPVLRTRIV